MHVGFSAESSRHLLSIKVNQCTQKETILCIWKFRVKLCDAVICAGSISKAHSPIKSPTRNTFVDPWPLLLSSLLLSPLGDFP